MWRTSFLLTLIVGIFFLALACTKDVGKDPALVPKSIDPCDSVTYSRTIKPIIDANCTASGCHVPGGSAPGDLTTYAKTADWATNGQFKLRVFDGFGRYMPMSGRLPDDQLAKLKCWMDAGAPNN